MQWMHIAIATRCMDFRYAEEADGDGSRLDFRVRPTAVSRESRRNSDIADLRMSARFSGDSPYLTVAHV